MSWCPSAIHAVIVRFYNAMTGSYSNTENISQIL